MLYTLDDLLGKSEKGSAGSGSLTSPLPATKDALVLRSTGSATYTELLLCRGQTNLEIRGFDPKATSLTVSVVKGSLMLYGRTPEPAVALDPNDLADKLSKLQVFEARGKDPALAVVHLEFSDLSLSSVASQSGAGQGVDMSTMYIPSLSQAVDVLAFCFRVDGTFPVGSRVEFIDVAGRSFVALLRSGLPGFRWEFQAVAMGTASLI